MRLKIEFEKKDTETGSRSIEITILKWVAILMTLGTAILFILWKYKEFLELWKN